MTWIAQVGHVMAKDVRQARWLLLTYLAIVTLATARALQWIGTFNGMLDTAMFVVVITGMFLVAYFVQSDSPFRGDAFWASRPFHPTAILAAKLLLALIIVAGPPLIGQVAAMTDSNVPIAMMSVLAGQSVWTYTSWLLIAMVLAAMTGDLKGFTTAVAGIPIVLGLLVVSSFSAMNVLVGPEYSISIAVTVLAICGAAGGLTLLAALYTKRTVTRRVWVTAAAVVVCMFVSIFLGQSRPAPETRNRVAELPGSSFRIHVGVAQQTQGRSYLTIRVDGVERSQQLVSLESATALLRLKDGTTIRVPLSNQTFELSRAVLPEEAGGRMLPSDSGTLSRQVRPVELSRRDREAVRKGIVAATIEGQVMALEPNVAVRVAFRPGAVARRSGTRVQVVTVNQAVDDSLAKIFRSSIRETQGEPWSRSGPWWNMPRYVLVNESRREAMIVAEGGSGSTADALVLPGAWRATHTTWLRSTPGPDATQKDDAWLAQSQLVFIDWIPLRPSSVRIEAVVDP